MSLNFQDEETQSSANSEENQEKVNQSEINHTFGAYAISWAKIYSEINDEIQSDLENSPISWPLPPLSEAEQKVFIQSPIVGYMFN